MNETILTAEQRSQLQKELGLTYHVPYLEECVREVGLAGKKVLEVGGSLPEKLVIDTFHADQWFGIEEDTYWNELNAEGHLGGYFRPELDGRVRLKTLESWPQDRKHGVFVGKVEDTPDALGGYFDLVFSIACFEHIHSLGFALQKMKGALKPGGKLFTMFSPIWSAWDGHHLPNIFENDKNISRDIAKVIPPWGHLLLRPPQMYHHLLARSFSPQIASQAVYYIYHNQHINRLMVEDYIEYVKMSGFVVNKALMTFAGKVPPETEKALRLIYPRNQHFSNNGLLLVLEKPAE